MRPKYANHIMKSKSLFLACLLTFLLIPEIVFSFSGVYKNTKNPNQEHIYNNNVVVKWDKGGSSTGSDVLKDTANDTGVDIGPIRSLLLGSGVTLQNKMPSLALMVAKDTDKIEMAWIPGSDGQTPADQIRYKIYLSLAENFTPGPSNLKKTATGTSQAEITGLAADTLYYAKIVAEYTASASEPSNTLQTKTYKYPIQWDNSTTVVKAEDLGLGKHTTVDGTTYSYSGGTPPAAGSALFSEDEAGGVTLRTVNSASSSGGTVTVHTSDASLTDVFDRASIYSAFQLFDVASEADALPSNNNRIATARSTTHSNGSLYSRMDWKNRLLSAEQTINAYDEPGLKVTPQGKRSIIKLLQANAVEQSFTATVTAEFEPQLITTAEWGGTVVKQLDSAKVAAKGTLSLTALAQYDFSASGSISKDFQLFKRTWTSLYPVDATGLWVYQEVTLYMDVTAAASAQAEIKAMAQTNLTETVEVGATYNGSTWTPYITHNESDSLTASLNIVGGANSEIRLIPKVEVTFYKVVSSSLTVEPLAQSSLTFEETTNNADFLTAHPNRLIHLTSFDASLGLESNIAVTLGALGYSWDVLPSTCVLGTGSCLYTFNDIDLFSIPELELSTTSSTETQTDLKLQITDGTHNGFSQGSVTWEVFPDDATITAGSCSKSGQTTTCTATFEPGPEEEYTVFSSGYGKLGEIGRQFEEITLGGGTCASGPQTVMWQGREWQRCDNESYYNWYRASGTYHADYNPSSTDICGDLVLDGHSDWRLPTKDELKSLVVCTNGTPTPLVDYIDGNQHPYYCGDGNSAPYDTPTIDMQFSCRSHVYWSSSTYDAGHAWFVSFLNGLASWHHRAYSIYVRCVR